MENIIEYVTGLAVGEPQTYRNMSVFPLMGNSSGLDYLVFDEAMNAGLKITETGSVPTLHFTNNTGKKVLIMQGEYAVGGKQNRMVATNVLMAKGFDGDVPVRCVQQGRWTGGLEGVFYSAQRKAPHNVMMAESQQGVWSEVSNLSADLGVRSATGNLEDSFSQRANDVGDYTSNFDYVPGSVGIVVVLANGGISISADIFDKQSTMRKNFNKIVESHALEAISNRGLDVGVVNSAAFDPAEFLEKIASCQFHERTAVSLGRDFRLVGPISGFALDNYGAPLYVSLSSTTVRRPIQIPRFETRFSRGGDINWIID